MAKIPTWLAGLIMAYAFSTGVYFKGDLIALVSFAGWFALGWAARAGKL